MFKISLLEFTIFLLIFFIGFSDIIKVVPKIFRRFEFFRDGRQFIQLIFLSPLILFFYP